MHPVAQLLRPRPRLGERVVDDPGAQLDDEVAPLCERDEPLGIDQADAGTLPAQERLAREKGLAYVTANAGIDVVLDLELPLSTLNYDSAARSVANSKADYMFFIHDPGADAFAAALHDVCRQLAHLVVMRRPGWEAPAEGPLGALIRSRQVGQAAELARSAAGGLLFCTVTQLEISATYIRQQLSQGMNPRYLLPDRVLGYLRDEHIYD